jgi:hypothetical protein
LRIVALRVCGFMGGVKGKSRVYGSSTCVLLPCGVCGFMGGVNSKPSIEVLALMRCVEYCLRYAWNNVSRNRNNICV